MKPTLLLISDLWGRKKSDWIEYYTQQLSDHFSVQYVDCCELGQIDTSVYTQEHLHQQFVQGGIDKAVERFNDSENEAAHLLAFSVGGTIAWKACLQGLSAASLTCVSATRLRHETIAPSLDIQLYFAQEDAFQPKKEWYDQLSITSPILITGEHDIYRSAKAAEVISKDLIQKILN